MIRKICDLSDGYDIIIIAKPKFLNQDFESNYSCLEKAYKIIKGK
jgi:RNase P protein component